MTRTLLAALALLAVSAAPAVAQTGADLAPAPAATAAEDEPSPEALAAARDLLEATGMAVSTRQLFQDQVARAMGMLQSQRPDMPGRAFDIIEEEFDTVAPEAAEALIAIATRMYAQRFTVEEMEALSAFYRSDLGQKALEEMRAISQAYQMQSRAIGQTLSQAAADRAAERIEAEGIEVEGGFGAGR